MPVVESKLLTRANGNEYIGVLTLNKEASLNALNLEMVQLMTKYLDEWRTNDSVVAVFIEGAGTKAFCAGGDVVSMHTAMKDERTKQNLGPRAALSAPPTFMTEFFTQEYTLDYAIHCYPKPLIVWGNGIVMGGGLGLFAAAKFAVATETSRIAMPEISIGLFPDVGGSYFLNQMPVGVGLFLGLTGASFNGRDAFDIKLASHNLSAQNKETLLSQLASIDKLNDKSVNRVLSNLHSSDAAIFADIEGKLQANLSAFAGLADLQSLPEIIEHIKHLLDQNGNERWWLKALKTLENGSPITANLVLHQLRRSKAMSLAECFRQELNMAAVCSMFGEFEEGVRALLIDKDLKPKWLYGNSADVPNALIEQHFGYFNDAIHPLHALEHTYGVTHV